MKVNHRFEFLNFFVQLTGQRIKLLALKRYGLYKSSLARRLHTCEVINLQSNNFFYIPAYRWWCLAKIIKIGLPCKIQRFCIACRVRNAKYWSCHFHTLAFWNLMAKTEIILESHTTNKYLSDGVLKYLKFKFFIFDKVGPQYREMPHIFMHNFPCLFHLYICFADFLV